MFRPFRDYQTEKVIDRIHELFWITINVSDGGAQKLRSLLALLQFRDFGDA